MSIIDNNYIKSKKKKIIFKHNYHVLQMKKPYQQNYINLYIYYKVYLK